ncbi:hypothetical protein CDD82_3968 [Ophiocordyceps australis]|uniref:Uncharacterized protein n=1 Tax=Ophiocordyceps australis TaxID=1399860 RepID=A0A2C5ZBD8_9HYPO|nr:hypothetical protein CDD82_3968 [Ophiocordyceps australis]
MRHSRALEFAQLSLVSLVSPLARLEGASELIWLATYQPAFAEAAEGTCGKLAMALVSPQAKPKPKPSDITPG